MLNWFKCILILNADITLSPLLKPIILCEPPSAATQRPLTMDFCLTTDAVNWLPRLFPGQTKGSRVQQLFMINKI